MAIDSFVWFVLFMLGVVTVAVMTGQLEVAGSSVDVTLEGWPGLAAFVLWLGLGVGYHTLLEWRFGRTIGKALVKIRVVSGDGTRPSLRASLVRNVVRLVDWLPAFYLVGIPAMALSNDSQRLGDRAGGTVVVRT